MPIENQPREWVCGDEAQERVEETFAFGAWERERVEVVAGGRLKVRPRDKRKPKSGYIYMRL